MIQGRDGVLLTMSSAYEANTLEVTRDVETVLQGMRPVFEANGIQVFPRLHRPASFIENSLGNMKHSLALGAILVAVVLFFMLGSARNALISLVAIPLTARGRRRSQQAEHYHQYYHPGWPRHRTGRGC